jgi:hypothetical protein
MVGCAFTQTVFRSGRETIRMLATRLPDFFSKKKCRFIWPWRQNESAFFENSKLYTSSGAAGSSMTGSFSSTFFLCLVVFFLSRAASFFKDFSCSFSVWTDFFASFTRSRASRSSSFATLSCSLVSVMGDSAVGLLSLVFIRKIESEIWNKFREASRLDGENVTSRDRRDNF